MKAAIYIRVSTEKQTVKSQEEPCRKYCKDKKYEIYGIFIDEAKSAYHNVKRKQYDKVIDLVKKREIQHIVVWALDRWTRRGPKELKESIDYLSVYDVQLHSIQETWLDTINIPGIGKVVKDFLIGIVGWIAQEESTRKSERVKLSKKYQKAVKKGKVGRPGIPESIRQKVLKLLEEGKSYKYIQENVTYKAKYGKVKHISPPTISEIKKSSLGKGDLYFKGKSNKESTL